jgi:hypothetical protein
VEAKYSHKVYGLSFICSSIKRVEPEKRLVGGKYGWAVHRFPIKNGKTYEETVWKEFHDTLRDNIMKRYTTPWESF